MVGGMSFNKESGEIISIFLYKNLITYNEEEKSISEAIVL